MCRGLAFISLSRDVGLGVDKDFKYVGMVPGNLVEPVVEDRGNCSRDQVMSGRQLYTNKCMHVELLMPGIREFTSAPAEI
jgi:hypothetical protein